jgi:hypothetical protein
MDLHPYDIEHHNTACHDKLDKTRFNVELKLWLYIIINNVYVLMGS